VVGIINKVLSNPRFEPAVISDELKLCINDYQKSLEVHNQRRTKYLVDLQPVIERFGGVERFQRMSELLKKELGLQIYKHDCDKSEVYNYSLDDWAHILAGTIITTYSTMREDCPKFSLELYLSELRSSSSNFYLNIIELLDETRYLSRYSVFKDTRFPDIIFAYFFSVEGKFIPYQVNIKEHLPYFEKYKSEFRLMYHKWCSEPGKLDIISKIKCPKFEAFKKIIF
jgi:hypothetical protein